MRSVQHLTPTIALILVGLLPQPEVGPAAALFVLVTDRESGGPVASAVVRLETRARETAADGIARFEVDPGDHALSVSRLGFEPVDTVVTLAGSDTIHVALRPRPLSLEPVTALARRREGGAARERALYFREPVPGLVGISRLEIREIPILAEADILRSLQTLPGVTQTNDLSARLSVAGGAPDQNVYRLDGARVFAPYHMFGIFGGFNADAIGRAELYRGQFPARYGGALSSVVELEHRQGSADAVEGAAGLGMLGARMLLSGPLPGGAGGSWMVAGRRTHADLVLDRYTQRGFPYAFWDVHGQATFRPGPGHRVRASAFGSSDRFRLFLEQASERMTSRWQNGVASVRWDWSIADNLTVASTGWVSGYDAAMGFGGGVDRPESNNDVRIVGFHSQIARVGTDFGLRFGVDAAYGRIGLAGGDRPGGLFRGRAVRSYDRAALFLEGEKWLGPLRLAPGLRLEYLAGSLRLAPRAFARLRLWEDGSLTVGFSRSHQAISTLRDDRFPLPGPPFWFAHGTDDPPSRADGFSAALEGWLGGMWSYAFSAYYRDFARVARWRPEGERNLDDVALDGGSATGAAVSLRRHTGTLRGWVGYDYSNVRFVETGTGTRYAPPWDLTHSVQGALSLHPTDGLVVSGSLKYTTGAPFWVRNGAVPVHLLDPLNGAIMYAGSYPTWSDSQDRLPDYLRIDLAARWPFRWGNVTIEPHLSVLNLTGRQNVLYYVFRSTGIGPTVFGGEYQLVPELQLPIPTAFPSVGIDLRF